MKVFIITNTGTLKGGWWRYAADLDRALQNKGHTTLLLKGLQDPLSYLRSPLRVFSDVYRVRRALAAFKPDVVHITVEPYLFLLPFLPRQKRVVLTVHGTYSFALAHVSRLLTFLYRPWFRLALGRTDRIIAISDYTKKYLKASAEQGRTLLPPITVIPNGIDVSSYPFVEKPLSQTRKRILMVGVLRPHKGARESIAALTRYRARYGGDFDYHIIGSYADGEEYTQLLRADIQREGLGDRVVFRGQVSDAELQKEYAEADLFLMLSTIVKTGSRRRFEGFGLVYLEANACGVPAIGSAEGGSAEAIKDGVSGFVVDAHDPDAVAVRIHDVFGGAIDRHEARRWAEAHDIFSLIDDVLALYV